MRLMAEIISLQKCYNKRNLNRFLLSQNTKIKKMAKCAILSYIRTIEHNKYAN